MEAFFPRAVQITLPDGNWHRTLRWPPGVHEIPDALVGHWWLKANGVQIPPPPPRPPRKQIVAPSPERGPAKPKSVYVSMFRPKANPADAPAADRRARFKHLSALPDEIEKLGAEIEADARSIVETDIAEVRAQKAAVFEQAGRVLTETRDTLRGFLVR
jgi:hypothetical protein